MLSVAYHPQPTPRRKRYEHHLLLPNRIAGWLAGKLTKGAGFGLTGNLLVGLVGAILGGFLFGLLGLTANGLIGSLVTATVGAVALLALIGFIKKS